MEDEGNRVLKVKEGDRRDIYFILSAVFYNRSGIELNVVSGKRR